MITITWGDLKSGDFIESLGKLCSKPCGFESGMKLAIVGKRVREQQRLYSEKHDSLLKKYGKPDDKSPGNYKLEESTYSNYLDEVKVLSECAFQINIQKFDAAAMSEHFDFSAKDLIVLEPLFQSLDGEPSN